jgi:hypothetical protein
MEEKPVISASRTKDLVRVSPARLAEILRGDAPARFSLSPRLQHVPLERIGALAIWTKDPANMLHHPELREALERYVLSLRGAILLNLTVTGLGGTALEPGIPSADEVRATVEALIEGRLVCPEGIILRYDPLIRVWTPKGNQLGNISTECFESVLESFRALGVKRFKTSLVDDRYAHVPKRLASVGLSLDLPRQNGLALFYQEMDRLCAESGARLDICCHPESFVTEKTSGCIDGFLINRLLERSHAQWRVSTTLHNEIGRQRKTCRCTYSRDIGYSPGIATCFKSHGACIYCYSQRNLGGGPIELASALVKSLDSKAPGPANHASEGPHHP